MKKYFHKFMFIATLGLVAISCEKDEQKIFLETGTAPALTISTTTPQLPSNASFDGDLALTMNWTNPDYKFTTGPSSQNVQYKIEIDTVGANFGSNSKGEVVISGDLGKTFTVGQLNELLSGLNFMALTPDRSYKLEARVISSIGNFGMPLISNTTSFTATPFSPPPAVALPTAGTLWVIGDAFAGGWDNPTGAANANLQKFTKVSNTLYELTVAMKGGGGYKLIQEQGNWDTQYRMIDGGTWEGGTFKKENSDPQFVGGPTAGMYKITVNFQSGKFSVTKQ